MDEAVKTMRCFALAGMLVAAGAAAGQALSDPTRPPANLQARQAGAAGSGVAPERRGPHLQSVLIARQPGGRHIAVIDGETLRLGDIYQGARVARIEQNQVELVRGRARQVLTLDAPTANGAAGIGRAPSTHAHE